jgi:hypothetical protein
MRGTAALALSLAAVLWGAVLLGGAVTFPLYSGGSTTAQCADCVPSVQTESTATLVEVNGRGVLIVVGIPLAFALVTTGLLWRRLIGGSRVAYLSAWVLIGLLAIFTFLAMFSIASFIVPSVLLLVGAALLSHRPPLATPQAVARHSTE